MKSSNYQRLSVSSNQSLLSLTEDSRADVSNVENPLLLTPATSDGTDEKRTETITGNHQNDVNTVTATTHVSGIAGQTNDIKSKKINDEFELVEMNEKKHESNYLHKPEICIPHHNHGQYRLQQALVNFDKMNSNICNCKVICVNSKSHRNSTFSDSYTNSRTNRINIQRNDKYSSQLGMERAKLGEFVNLWDETWTDSEILYVYSHYLTQPRINCLETLSHDISSICSFAYEIPMDIWKTIVSYELGSHRVLCLVVFTFFSVLFGFLFELFFFLLCKNFCFRFLFSFFLLICSFFCLFAKRSFFCLFF